MIRVLNRKRWQNLLGMLRYTKRNLPVIIIFSVVLYAAFPGIVGFSMEILGNTLHWVPNSVNRMFTYHTSPIAPFFTPEVRYWEKDIARWADAYDLDPNMIATVMQIESCGHPTVTSSAGARGLFQVMPFHFANGEDHYDPETNARRSAKVLQECSVFASNDPAMTFACYNGGPSVTMKAWSSWANETQRYYRWSSGIYSDAQNGQLSSSTLTDWLNAGGSGLCAMASQELNLVQ